jgi:hydroxymethylpyrimidine pyrophosphatase-like HAD family hydrolase
MFNGHLMLVAIDFDHTLWDSANQVPMPGAKEAINLMREKGIRIIIHSCNNVKWIEKCCNNYDIRFDWIWNATGKPIADLYIDDRGYHFTDWSPAEVTKMLDLINQGNPMVKRD